MAIAGNTGAVAKRLGHRLADHIAAVLGGVVEIDMQIALRREVQIDQRMTRQLFHHMVEKANAGGHLVVAATIQIDGAGDFGFFGDALDPRAAFLGHRCAPRWGPAAGVPARGY